MTFVTAMGFGKNLVAWGTKQPRYDVAMLFPGPFVSIGPYKEITGRVSSIRMIDWKERCGIEFGLIVDGSLMHGISRKGVLRMRDVYLYDEGDRRYTVGSEKSSPFRYRYDPLEPDAVEDIEFGKDSTVYLVFRSLGSVKWFERVGYMSKPELEVCHGNPLSPRNRKNAG